MQSDDFMTVDVVIPCYNGMPYLRESLDSALAQTHRPARIIVVDDGSKDDSADCVRAYAQRYPDHGIEVIQKPNGGEPSARNAGIRAATACWVAMLDTDDWWEPTKLEKQLAAAREAGPECVMVHTGWIYEYPDGTSTRKAFDGPARRVGWCTEALLEPSAIGHPSIMVRRDALTAIDGYDETFRQSCDIDLYFRLSAQGTFAFVAEHLLHYRIHAKQMSASQIDQIPFHHRAVRTFFQKHPEIEQRIGRDRIEAGLATHVAVKLESLWWKRKLEDFRKLLDYAREHNLSNDQIESWRRRAAWPNWLIRLRDCLALRRSGA